jgi:hypothetical protein
VTFSVPAGRGAIEVTLMTRSWSGPSFGPERESVAIITFNGAFTGVPRPESGDCDQGGPLDQAWAAYNRAELGEMLAILGLIGAGVRNRADNGVIPDNWVPDRHAGCSLCPCTPGLRGDKRITVRGAVMDLHVDDHRAISPKGTT